MIEIFEWVIGNRAFPLEEIKNLYKKYNNSLLDGNLDIIEIKTHIWLINTSKIAYTQKRSRT